MPKYTFLALLLLTYVSFLIMPAMILFAWVFAPYLALGFMREAGARPSASYFVLAAAVIAGGYLLSVLISLYFLAAVIFPAVILSFFPQFRGKWLGTALCALPILIFVSVCLLYPGNRELYVAFITDALNNLLVQMKEQYSAAGAQIPDKLIAMIQDKESWADAIVRIFPAVAYCMTAMLIFTTEKFFFRISQENIMELPDFLLAVLIVGGIFVVIPKDALTFPGYNLLLIGGIFYFFRGFDISRYHLIRMKVHPLVRGFFYFIFLSQRFFVIMLAVVGLISVYKDLVRKPKKEILQ